jgi:tRNA(Ile)-lysidine synthase
MKGAKKVGDFLTDRKVPRSLRDEIPLVCDAAGIVWVVGHEIADRVKVDTGTRKVLTIAYGITKGKGRQTV